MDCGVLGGGSVRTLRFQVRGQQISPDPDCDFSGIVPGTAGYLQAEFSFSPEWRYTVKVAEFRRYETSEYYPVKIVSGRCTIPAEVLAGKAWLVNIVGKRGDMVITTNKCKVRQEG